MHEFHCYYREQLPVPGSRAPAVRYPACEWRMSELARETAGADTHDTADAMARHPMNRFLCSWLTSDMAELSRCDEVLHAIAHIESQHLAEWFADGDAFQVEIRASGVQFNASNVGPEDAGWWNLPEGRFDLVNVKAVLCAWRDFLAQTAAC